MGHKDWKRVQRDFLYEAKTPDEISCIKDRIKLKNGHEFDYIHVDSPYQVVYVIGINGDNEVLLIKQYRYLVKSEVIEIPAGSPEGDETLEAGAIREFEEETGYLTKNLVKLGEFYPSSGITNQVGHIYVATELTKTSQALEVTEDITVHWYPFDEAVQMVLKNEINNVGAAYGILLAKNWLEQR